jgi:ribonuclease HI
MRLELRPSKDMQQHTWIYWFGHAGVKGNEIADRLARKAVVNDVLEMDKSDQHTAIRQQLQLKKLMNLNKVPTTKDLKSFV